MCTSALIKTLGVGRAAIGLAALLNPVGVGLFFGFAADARLQTAVRYIGCRDLMMGAGLIIAEQRGHGRGWLEAAMAVDVVDGLITCWGVREEVITEEKARTVLPIILGSLALGGLLVAQLARGGNGGNDATIARKRLEK